MKTGFFKAQEGHSNTGDAIVVHQSDLLTMAAKRTRKLLVWVLCLHCALVSSQSTFQKTFGGPGNELAAWVVESTNGGFYIAGQVTNATGNQDAMLMRLDASGNPIWQKRYGGAQADAFLCAVATPDGGVVSVGETRSFGSESADVLIVYTNPDGTTLWSRKINDGFSDDVARSIVSLPGGGYLISGVSNLIGTTAFSSFFMRLDPAGNTLWSRTITSEVSNLLQSNYVADRKSVV